MKSFFHPASPILEKNPGTSHLAISLLSHFLHLCVSLPSLLPQTCHLTTLPPLQPCHLLSSHISHLASSLPSHTFPTFPADHPHPTVLSNYPSSLLPHLSRLTTLPMTNRSIQNGNVLPLGRQGKYMWLIARQLAGEMLSSRSRI